jgi:hypothetical protein
MSEPEASGVHGPAGSGSDLLIPRTHNPLVRRITGHKRYWLYSRLLATAGAVLIAAAAWLPWVSVRVFDVARADFVSGPLQLDPGDLDASYFGGQIWAALTVTGLLIVPFLWRRPGSARTPSLASLFYVVWMFALAFFGGTSVGYLVQPNTMRLAPELRSLLISTDHVHLMVGTWLGALGALFAVVAALALVIGMLRLPLDRRPPAAPARGPRPLVGALVFGVLLFWLGTLIFPWATVNCTAFPLFFGQCTGLPFSGVLSSAIRVDVPGLDPLAAIYGVNILLSCAALLVLIAVFRGARSRFFAFWTTLWLVLATGCVALAGVGVRLVASEPVQLGLPSSGWNGDMGIFVTLLSLALGWVSIIALWLSRQRSASA